MMDYSLPAAITAASSNQQRPRVSRFRRRRCWLEPYGALRAGGIPGMMFGLLGAPVVIFSCAARTALPCHLRRLVQADLRNNRPSATYSLRLLFVCVSLLSGLILYNGFPAAANVVEDDIGGGFPDERSWFVVPGRQPLIDGSLQFIDAMEGSATDHSIGDEPEQAFDLVEPGTARGGEMKVEASPLLRL